MKAYELKLKYSDGTLRITRIEAPNENLAIFMFGMQCGIIYEGKPGPAIIGVEVKLLIKARGGYEQV